MKRTILSMVCLASSLFINAQPTSLVWAKNMGGKSSASGNSIAIDATGNIYTTGSFSGTVDFNPGAGIFNLTASGDQDAFISKTDVSGNFVWAVKIGGLYSDFGIGIAVDALGNVYTTGSFGLTVDFDPGTGTSELTALGGNDIFILKLDASGNFIWVKRVGGTSIDDSYGLALDKSGNIYLTGDFYGKADFDPGAGIYELQSYGDLDIFVLKLSSSGNLIWAKNFGGTAADAGYGIAVDKDGNVYSTGLFQGTVDFDHGGGVYKFVSKGFSDMYVLKLDAGGNFTWSAQIGGPQYDYGYSLALDAGGNVYTTGWFYDTADFDPGVGTYNLTSTLGGSDIFVSKLSTSGNFVWAKNMGGENYTNSQGYGISVDASDNIYTTGVFQGTADFDPGTGVRDLVSAGYSDIFILKLNASGDYVWAGDLGGTYVDKGFSLLVDASANIYCTGEFAGTADFDPGAGVFDLTYSGGQSDVFIVKLDQSLTGIKDFTNTNTISVFPNPAHDVFKVAFSKPAKNASIEIYNSFGEIVAKQTIDNNINTINLTKQPNGLYFVNIMSENKLIKSQKIVKQ